jgi:hypothetical protein
MYLNLINMTEEAKMALLVATVGFICLVIGSIYNKINDND